VETEYLVAANGVVHRLLVRAGGIRLTASGLCVVFFFEYTFWHGFRKNGLKRSNKALSMYE
jgi:hypothetical protein